MNNSHITPTFKLHTLSELIQFQKTEQSFLLPRRYFDELSSSCDGKCHKKHQIKLSENKFCLFRVGTFLGRIK